MTLLICVLIFLLSVLLLPVMVLAIQVIIACFMQPGKRKPAASGQVSSIAILIPAHNEASGIATTLNSILPQLRQQDRIVVVADNCQDETAMIAKDLGAETVERHDTTKRGKGYALDFGLKCMQGNPPEVVLIVDADCIMAPGTINLLASACINLQRPVQALYLMKNPPQIGHKAQISEFAWVVRNQVRPLGMDGLGMPCQLMGTGMAFLWEDMRQVDLASGHIVEDMKLGVDFARMGKSPAFVPDALVTSYFPAEGQASTTQRTRWEHGHLSVIVNELPKLVWQAMRTGNPQMLAMAADLLVPPLALLSMLCVLLSIFAFVGYMVQPNTWLLVLPACLLGLLCLAVGLAWWKYARHIISLRQLCYVPVYMLAKLPIYLKFFVRRQVEWVRSKRD